MCPHKLLRKQSNDGWFETNASNALRDVCLAAMTTFSDDEAVFGTDDFPFSGHATFFFLSAIKKVVMMVTALSFGRLCVSYWQPPTSLWRKSSVSAFMWSRHGFLFSCHRFLYAKARDTLNFFSEGGIPYKLAPIPTENRSLYVLHTSFNTLRPGQNGHHFVDDIFKSIFLNENV